MSLAAIFSLSPQLQTALQAVAIVLILIGLAAGVRLVLGEGSEMQHNTWWGLLFVCIAVGLLLLYVVHGKPSEADSSPKSRVEWPKANP
jgi:hypothetical protein